MPHINQRLEHERTPIQGLRPVIALLTATKQEQQAVYALLRARFRNQSHVEGDLPLVDLGSTYLVVCAQEQMGALNTTAIVEELIHNYRPILVVLVGVCGALPGAHQKRGQNMRGHVFVGTDVLYYERYKERSWRDFLRDVSSFFTSFGYKQKDSDEPREPLWCRRWLAKWKPQKLPSKYQWQDCYAAEQKVKGMACRMSYIDPRGLFPTEGSEFADLCEEIRRSIDAGDASSFVKKLEILLENGPHVLVDQTYACGERFMSSRGMDRLSRALKKRKRSECWKQTDGMKEAFAIDGFNAFDMETAGVARACAASQTKYLFVKAASDTGEEDKTNEFHHAGTILAASVAIEWIRSLSIEELTSLHLRVWRPQEGPSECTVEASSIGALREAFGSKYLRQQVTQMAALASSMLPPPALILNNRAVATRTVDNLRTYYDGLIQAFLQNAFGSLLSAGRLGTGIEDITIRTDGDDIREDPFQNVGDRTLLLFVDPIDGTSNLAAGRPEVAISIAVYLGQEPVCGVIAIPYVNLVVYGVENEKQSRPCLFVNGLEWRREDVDPGATRESCGEDGRSLTVSIPGDFHRLLTPEKDGETQDSGQMLTPPQGAPPITPQKLLQEIWRFAPETRHNWRVSGSIAYDLVWVALGRLDVRISTHARNADVAAGAILVRALGGSVIDYDCDKKWMPSTGSRTIIASVDDAAYASIAAHLRAIGYRRSSKR